jgi:hypothetical protein
MRKSDPEIGHVNQPLADIFTRSQDSNFKRNKLTLLDFKQNDFA